MYDFNWHRLSVYFSDSEAKFRLEMSSIIYVHTNRFYTEFMSLYSALFGPLQQVATPHNENLSKGVNSAASDELSNSVTVTLDIQAGAPVLLLPYSFTSKELLVADLGHLSVRNRFEKLEQRILNLISVDLIEMDLYSAELKELIPGQNEETKKFWGVQRNLAVVRTAGNSSLLKQKCALQLQVRRMLIGRLADNEPETCVKGTLSALYCTVDSEKFKVLLLSNTLFQIDNFHVYM